MAQPFPVCFHPLPCVCRWLSQMWVMCYFTHMTFDINATPYTGFNTVLAKIVCIAVLSCTRSSNPCIVYSMHCGLWHYFSVILLLCALMVEPISRSCSSNCGNYYYISFYFYMLTCLIKWFVHFVSLFPRASIILYYLSIYVLLHVCLLVKSNV